MGAGIGETLREARRGRDIDLRDVERATKIRLRYLRAIEEERWDELPGRAYARGFLHTYAEFLDLDHNALVKRFEAEAHAPAQGELPPEPIIHEGTLSGRAWPRVARRLGAIAGVALVVVAVALALNDAPDEEPDGGAERSEPATEEGRTSEPEVGEGPSPETTNVPPAATTAERVSVRLEALGTVWVCLEDGRGRRLINSETLTVGERRGPFEASRLAMSFGNGEVAIQADGGSVDVPAASEPFGVEVTAKGAKDLEPSERPDCT